MTCRVLVTGLNGFTGQHLREHLIVQGFDVVALSLHGESVDINQTDAVRAAVKAANPHYVVHLAAIAFVAHADVQELYKTNVVGTRNLLSALATEAPLLRHVIIASSANVYGHQPAGLVSEQAHCVPANDYAVSKFAMEHMVALWRGQLPITIVRPFNYVGIGQSERFVIAKIVQHFRARASHLALGNLAVWREYNDVRWLVAVYAQLMLREPSVLPINIATGQLYSLSEVIQLTSQIASHHVNVVCDPQLVRAKEVTHLGGDNTHLQSLNLAAPNYTLEQTLQWMMSCE